MTETKEKIRILAVDDSKEALEIIQRQLGSAGYEVRTASGVEEAVAVLEFSKVDMVITDIKMPKFDGFDLLRYIRENVSDTEVMMVTAYPRIEGAVQSIRDGAEDYLVKPFTEEELLSAVSQMKEKIIRRRTVHSEIRPVKSYGIIGQSPAIRKVFALIDKAASTLANVLISGESGTGKELVARAIHYGSERAQAPFVSVNCTAIPDTLLESELFGHVKGAFTGAGDSRAGYFQIADRGTIFLDEIGDASLNMQGKLLRVIQNKEINMVGSSRVRRVDTRIITATHKDLSAMVRKGQFREDLWYRLNVIEVHIPPLRERREDILYLTSWFAQKYAREMGREIPSFTDNALQALKNFNWPGNVRELENLVQRLVVVTDTPEIDVSDLPESMRFTVCTGKGTARTLAEVEAGHILNVMASVGGNKTRAAEILGVDRKTLRQKLMKAEKMEL